MAVDYITYLIINEKGEKLHYSEEKGYYMDKKIDYNNLVSFTDEEEADDNLKDLWAGDELKGLGDLYTETFFEVDDVLIKLDKIASFVSDNWDGERIGCECDDECEYDCD